MPGRGSATKSTVSPPSAHSCNHSPSSSNSTPRGRAARQLGDQLNVAMRTLERWRRWWREEFLRTPLWQAARSRFMPPLVSAQLPLALLDRFEAECPNDRLAQALRFLSPLSH